MSGPVLIMAGGTGGHVFPALALARLLRDRQREVVWLGTRRGLEARIVPADGFPMEWLGVGGLRGKSLMTQLAAPFRLGVALWQALSVMRRHRPAVVVGLGGFVTGPGGIAAWLCRRPLVIHEQNAIAGFTNRCLARLAREVLTAFPGAFAPHISVREIGNPVRRDIAALAKPSQRFAGRSGPVRILVVGGSLGATRLNSVVPMALAEAQRRGGLVFDVHHQAGEKLIGAARANYAQTNLGAQVNAFVEDMAAAYGWADLVVCRSGALTVSELAAAGVGAVLVPYPHAVDDHQTHNAEFLVQAGAAVRIPDGDLTATRLADELIRLCSDRQALEAMAERARDRARPDAAEQLLARCLVAAGEAA